MKSSKEFFERLQNDEAFSKEISDAIAARRDAGARNYYETVIPVAEEHGYEITEEELDEINQYQTQVLSEEELGKVAGGSSCIPVWMSVVGVSFVSVTSAVLSAGTASVITRTEKG